MIIFSDGSTGNVLGWWILAIHNILSCWEKRMEWAFHVWNWNGLEPLADLCGIIQKSLALLFRPEVYTNLLDTVYGYCKLHGRWKQCPEYGSDLLCTLQGPGQAVSDMFEMHMVFVGKPAVFSIDVAASIFFGWICRTWKCSSWGWRAYHFRLLKFTKLWKQLKPQLCNITEPASSHAGHLHERSRRVSATLRWLSCQSLGKHTVVLRYSDAIKCYWQCTQSRLQLKVTNYNPTLWKDIAFNITLLLIMAHARNISNWHSISIWTLMYTLTKQPAITVLAIFLLLNFPTLGLIKVFFFVFFFTNILLILMINGSWSDPGYLSHITEKKWLFQTSLPLLLN